MIPILLCVFHFSSSSSASSIERYERQRQIDNKRRGGKVKWRNTRQKEVYNKRGGNRRRMTCLFSSLFCSLFSWFSFHSLLFLMSCQCQCFHECYRQQEKWCVCNRSPVSCLLFLSFFLKMEKREGMEPERWLSPQLCYLIQDKQTMKMQGHSFGRSQKNWERMLVECRLTSFPKIDWLLNLYSLPFSDVSIHLLPFDESEIFMKQKKELKGKKV